METKSQEALEEATQVLQDNRQPRLRSPEKLSVITERKIKASRDKNSLKEFMTTRSALQKVFEGMKRKPVRLQERINHIRKITQERKRRCGVGELQCQQSYKNRYTASSHNTE